MIFRPEHATDISVYLLNQIFESVSDLPKSKKDIKERNIKKDITPTYIIVCVSISSCSIEKRLRIAVFLSIKLKTKKCTVYSRFWVYYWKHIYI